MVLVSNVLVFKVLVFKVLGHRFSVLSFPNTPGRTPPHECHDKGQTQLLGLLFYTSANPNTA